MPSFTYKAVNDSGAPTTGVLTAENYQVALRMLEEQALFPVNVTEGLGDAGFGRSSKKRVKLSHLTTLYGQLADLLRAGVPMLRSLDVLAKQTTTGALSQAVKELREDVAGGMSLGLAMGKHPHAFSPLDASMVRAGEEGGFLEDVLERIAIFAEKQDELKNKVFGAMIYPAILVFVGGAVVLMLMLFVVPKLREHLRPETFNVVTVAVFGVCDLLMNHYIMLLLVVSGLGVGIYTWLKTDHGQLQFDRFKLKAPLLGPILTMVAICRFCRILGTMLHNGVPILQALKISKDSAGNQILVDLIDEAGDSVRKGAPLSDPLRKSGLFPLAVVDMIAVAEEGNNLETVLVQIADTNEIRTARKVDLAVRILEPILLVIMAMAVFFIALGLLLPILTMGTVVS